MATTFKWVISATDCAPSQDGYTDVVKAVHYRYQGHSEDGFFDEVYDRTMVDGDLSDFVPFEELIDEIVITWLEATLDVEELQAKVEAKIEKQRNPEMVTKPLPTTTTTTTEAPTTTTTVESETTTTTTVE